MKTSTQIGDVVQVVEDLIRALVDHANEVDVKSVNCTQMTILEVRTARDDHGKVVGRGGRTISALRQLIVGGSGAQKRRYALDMVETDGTSGPLMESSGLRVGDQMRASVNPSIRQSFNTASSRFEEDPVRVTRGLLDRTVRLLVDNRDAVSVSAVEGRQVVVFEVVVDQDDVRRVIGAGGRQADAVRLLLLNLGTRVARRFILDIVEPVERVSKAATSAT